MTETIRYALISKQDLRLGTGTFEVTLADGRRVTLDEVDLAAILNEFFVDSPIRLKDTNGTLIHAFGTKT